MLVIFFPRCLQRPPFVMQNSVDVPPALNGVLKTDAKIRLAVWGEVDIECFLPVILGNFDFELLRLVVI